MQSYFTYQLLRMEKKEITESSLDSPCIELVIFAFFRNTAEICLPSFFSTLINQHFFNDILVFLSLLSAYSLSLHSLTTVRCMANFHLIPIFEGEIDVFLTKFFKWLVEILSRYIVTEIQIFLECLVLKGMSFNKLQHFYFEVIFIFMMSDITSLKECLWHWYNKNRYYLRYFTLNR